jgi:hypothetical protein
MRNPFAAGDVVLTGDDITATIEGIRTVRATCAGIPV